MDFITKEYLHGTDAAGYSMFLKCDIPIWEEFALGLIDSGSYASNNRFKGVRGLRCQVPDKTMTYKDIYVVTQNPKSQRAIEYIKRTFTCDTASRYYGNVNIQHHKRQDKDVYIIEFQYK